MTARELLERQVALLRESPRVDAVGVGGSLGRGDADDASDVDVFVVYADEDFWPAVRAFPDEVTHPVPVISAGPGRFMSDYGYRYAYLLEGAPKIEYYLNAPTTMTPFPLSARITVLGDRSGWLTQLLDDAAERHGTAPQTAFALGVHECLVDLFDLRKHCVRGDLLGAVWRLHTLRRTVMALHAMQAAGDPYAPSSSVRQLRQRHGDAVAEDVEATTAAANPESVRAAFERLRAIMAAAWRGPRITGVPTAAQLRLEHELSGAILAALRRGAGAER